MPEVTLKALRDVLKKHKIPFRLVHGKEAIQIFVHTTCGRRTVAIINRLAKEQENEKRNKKASTSRKSK